MADNPETFADGSETTHAFMAVARAEITGLEKLTRQLSSAAECAVTDLVELERSTAALAARESTDNAAFNEAIDSSPLVRVESRPKFKKWIRSVRFLERSYAGIGTTVRSVLAVSEKCCVIVRLSTWEGTLGL